MFSDNGKLSVNLKEMTMISTSHCKQISYKLVFKFFKQPVMKYCNGYIKEVGNMSGHLIEVNNSGVIHYELVEDHLSWK